MTLFRLPPAALALAVMFGGCGETDDPSLAQGENAPRMPGRYDARAFFATTTYSLPSGYAWSADGTKLLVSSDESGIFNAWSLAAVDGARQALTTSSTDSIFAVSWFPDDDRILFTADRGGNEINHLYVRELSGETRDLTPGDETKAQFGGWSGDRRHFFVLTNERDPETFDLYRYAAKDYARTLIFRNDYALQVSAVSPDGSYVALVKPRTSADSDIFLLDALAADGEPRLITSRTGNVSHGVHDFTRDGAKLVYSTDEHGEFNQAWTYDVGTGAKAPLIGADWDVMFVSFSESGRYRVSATNEDARTVVRILDTRSGKDIALPGLPAGDLAQIRFSRDETAVALMVSSDTSPSDVYRVASPRVRARGSPRRSTPRSTKAISSPPRSFVTGASTNWKFRRYCIARRERRRRTRRRRWYGCMAARAGRAAPVTHRPSSTSSTTAMPCWPQTIAAHPATARRSSTWTTGVTATWTSRISSARRATWHRSTGSTAAVSASSAVPTAATW